MKTRKSASRTYYLVTFLHSADGLPLAGYPPYYAPAFSRKQDAIEHVRRYVQTRNPAALIRKVKPYME